MRLFVGTILLLFACGFSAPQTDIGLVSSMPNIENSFKLADAQTMSGYFNEPIELVFDNSFDVYSKNQAEIVLKDFFSKNPPLSFTVTHSRKKDGINYIVGTLKTSQKTFTVYLLIEEINSQALIHHLRIDTKE